MCEREKERERESVCGGVRMYICVYESGKSVCVCVCVCVSNYG